MTNPTRLYIEDNAKDIPLHTFGNVADENSGNLPFMHFTFSDKLPFSLASNPHRHTFYEILYITSGYGNHFIDFHAHPIEPNTLYFLSPGQVHYWETDGSSIEGNVFLFTDDFLLLAPTDFMVLHELSFFHSHEDSQAIRLSSAEHSLVASVIDAVSNEYQRLTYRSESFLRAYLHIFLVHVQRICANHNSHTTSRQDTPTQKLVRHFKQLVSQQFLTGQSVSGYAHQLSVTVAHLNNSVKSVTGQTPGRLIRQEVVLEAKRLFAYSEMTAAEVGYRLGFDDPSYFSRFFQRETGVSTVEFRHSLLEKYQIEK